jgi:hypothetical protein
VSILCACVCEKVREREKGKEIDDVKWTRREMEYVGDIMVT